MNAIICAAIRNPTTGQVIKGHRHFDSHMQHKLSYNKLDFLDFTEQGFIDMYGNYVSRTDALVIVRENSQYINEREVVGNELFSEALY